jgi:hypothetical protein
MNINSSALGVAYSPPRPDIENVHVISTDNHSTLTSSAVLLWKVLLYIFTWAPEFTSIAPP